MTQAEMRRRRARRKRRRTALNIARGVAVALVAGTVLFWAAKYDGGEQEAQAANEFLFNSGSDDVYYVQSLPASDGWLDGAESAPVLAEGRENGEIEAVLPEEEYLSDEIPLDYDTQAALRSWCDEYSVPYQLALAVIEAESSFNPEASNGNCYGYMQINSINQEWLGEKIGVTDLTNPLQNLHSGVFMLGHLYEKYEDWQKVLLCYNCGETGAYDHYFSQGRTSSSYSRHVMELEEKWAEVISQ